MSYSHEEILTQYRAAVNQVEGIEVKGKTMPYTSVNGHMTSFLDKEGKMGLRLSKEEIEVFIKEHKSTLMEQHGRTMKDFVVVPAEAFNDSKQLLELLEVSVSHALGLKPK